jgi:hypothetical protein
LTFLRGLHDVTFRWDFQDNERQDLELFPTDVADQGAAQDDDDAEKRWELDDPSCFHRGMQAANLDVTLMRGVADAPRDQPSNAENHQQRAHKDERLAALPWALTVTRVNVTCDL